MDNGLTNVESAAIMAYAAVIYLIAIACCILILVDMWRLFEKAYVPGWKAIIPIYNLYILNQIATGETVWFILMFVPMVNTIIELIVYYKFAKSYGQSTAMSIGTVLAAPIFLTILAFKNDVNYIGPQPLSSK